MRFGPVPVPEAEGAILAHSLALPDGRLRKGRVLGAGDLARLKQAGISHVVVARLEAGDLDEDAAAAALGAALVPPDGLLSATAPFTGRVNLHAEVAGLVSVDTRRVAAMNAVDEAITLATLPDLARVAPRTMVATVKVVAYGVAAAAVAQATARAAGALRLHPVRHRTATLVLTRLPGTGERLLEKGRDAIAARLSALGITLLEVPVVDHDTAAIAAALAAARGDLVLVLTASATSDREDVGPAALGLAGGRLERFGMPVDPGNLLFLGAVAGRPVIGLPGCARSPALNGADWVLERVACGLEVTAGDIAAMGVGGLLKEIPIRPQPRDRPERGPGLRPRIAALVLPGAGDPAAMAESLAAARLSPQLAVATAGSPVPEGMTVLPSGTGTPVAAAVARLPAEIDALMLVQPDRPVAAATLSRMTAAFSPADGREIVHLAGSAPGEAPLLLGRRFFEVLAVMESAAELSAMIEASSEFRVEITALPGGSKARDVADRSGPTLS